MASHHPPMFARPEAEDFVVEVRRVENLVHQAAVHCKKFEYAVALVHRISECLLEHAMTDHQLSQDEVDATNILRLQMQELVDLLNQNLIRTWSQPTVNNPSQDVLNQLIAIFHNIADAVVVFDRDVGDEVTPDRDKWRMYHMLDLRAIAASFTQYLKSKELGGDLSKAIEARLLDINRALEEGKADEFALRVFSPIPMDYQEWHLNSDDFVAIRQVGKGASAEVFYGRDKRTNREVAIKKFKVKMFRGARLQAFQREVALLATAVHPAVIELIGATDIPLLCIITAWMPHGSLYDDIHRYHRLDQTEKTIAAFDVARGMEFLHSRQIVHRDLKSLNVLVDSNNRVRICDFGFSRYASEESHMTHGIGTPHWMAPELLEDRASYTSKVDVYAFGIVLWELATGMRPYNGIGADEITERVLEDDLRPTMPVDLNPGMRDLIHQCWDKDPNVRPPFDEVVRRMRSTEAMFDDTDMNVFLQYIEESATSDEQLKHDVEYIVGRVMKGAMSVRDATKRLSRTGVPHDAIDIAWSAVTKIVETCEPRQVAKYMKLFIKSPKVGQAAAILRQTEPKSVPIGIVTEFVAALPSGSSSIDMDIVVMACRNSGADLCVVYATDITNVELAMNVCARLGVDVQLKAAVCDRCVQCMGSTNANLAAAATRCLLAVGEFMRIRFGTLVSFLESEDERLSTWSYVAIAAMAKRNRFPPRGLFDVLVKAMETDDRAVPAVVLSCVDQDLAELMITKYAEEQPAPSADVFKVLICAARHHRLRPLILHITTMTDFSTVAPDRAEAESLMDILRADQ